MSSSVEKGKKEKSGAKTGTVTVSSSGGSRKKSAASASKSGKAAKSAQTGKKPKKNPAGSRMRDEITAVIMVALGIFLLIAVITDAAGGFGEVLSMVLKGFFGRCAYILPFFLIIYALLILMNHMAHINSRTVVFSLLLYEDLALLNSAFYSDLDSQLSLGKYAGDMFYAGVKLESGGVLGMVPARLIASCAGVAGLVIASIAIMIICGILIANTPVSVFFDRRRE